MPVAAGLGAHQPNRRLRLAAEPQTGRREVSALTDARKTLAYDFFRILRAPHIGSAKGNPWVQDINHRVTLWLPWRIGFVRGGNHSMALLQIVGGDKLIIPFC
ncbi:DUF6710 family protein [Salmonella enterica]|uniref:DUF6710 family protein n=1 Tax=Salmonella enterica TaxID=28901 RepID=UPI00289DCC62|nr:DUF6710 family protein [Salmonella enterica]